MQAFPPIVMCSVVLLLIANTLNMAADVAAMGKLGELVSGVSRHLVTTFDQSRERAGLFFQVGTGLPGKKGGPLSSDENAGVRFSTPERLGAGARHLA